MTIKEARRMAKGFIKIMEIKAWNNPTKQVTEILEEMLVEHALQHWGGEMKKKKKCPIKENE